MAQKKNAAYYMGFKFLNPVLLYNNLPFVGFLAFLAVIYIGVVHYAQGNVRRIQVLERELKEMRWYYRSLEAENMINCKQSEIAEQVRDEGLRMHRGNIKKIIIDPDVSR